MTNSPPTRQRANDLMLLFAERTMRASGRWSPTKLSNEIPPRRSHGRGAAPLLHTPLPARPSPRRRSQRVALLMSCSFAYVAGTRGPVGLPLAQPGSGSQSQAAPVSGKLLPIYLASWETIFPRKNAAPPACYHQEEGGRNK